MKKKVRVAIAGVGNCCSSLVQGCSFYRDDKSEAISGVMHAAIGGYRIEDIEFVAAFDVDKRKVGKPLHEAIFAKPNCTLVFEPVLKPEIGNPTVQMGNVLDGVAEHLKDYPEEDSFRVAENVPTADVVQILKDSKADVLLNYMPVGSEKATRYYAECCLAAGVAMVNCMPVFLTSTEDWAERFKEAGLPILGDDIKSQFGATLLHRIIARNLEERGYLTEQTYQTNQGGNQDFLTMVDRTRLKSKKISKTQAVTSQIKPMDSRNIHVGPSDYIPFLNDTKICNIFIKAKGFGGAPLELNLKLDVIDSPNSAGVTIDAVRYAKTAKDRGYAGPLVGPSAYLFKSPPVQMPDPVAKKICDEFAQEPRLYNDPEVQALVDKYRKEHK